MAWTLEREETARGTEASLEGVLRMSRELATWLA
jgi:hypothetical protein